MASDGSPTPATIVAEEKRVSPTAALINMSTYISEIEGEGLAIGGYVGFQHSSLSDTNIFALHFLHQDIDMGPQILQDICLE